MQKDLIPAIRAASSQLDPIALDDVFNFDVYTLKHSHVSVHNVSVRGMSQVHQLEEMYLNPYTKTYRALLNVGTSV